MANVISIGAQWETTRADLVGYFIVALLVVALLRFWWRRRRPHDYYGQSMGQPEPPRPQPVEPDLPKKMTMAGRLFAIVFFSVWLTGWTAGCYMAGRAWLGLSFGDEGYIFLLVWLAIAVPGWFFAAWTLFRLLRGDDVELSFDGDDSGGGD